MERVRQAARASIAVTPPFRLDLTAALIRRFSPASRGECDWNDGTFICSIPGPRGPGVVTISQPNATTLHVLHAGSTDTNPAIEASVCVMLGLMRDMTNFDAAAATIPWLREFAGRMRGVRPARTASVWEAGVTAIVYQSVSMAAAGSVLDRFIRELGSRASALGSGFTLFPSCAAAIAASDVALRATGLSTAKVAAIRAVAAVVMAGEWDMAKLEALPTADLCERLARVRGIGPWSAAVIALRAFGRLDVFPLRDSGVTQTIGALCGHRPNATADALAVLGESRGMLYHHLLLARLDARGLLPAA